MGKKKKKKPEAEDGRTIVAVNKTARRNYHIIDTFEAGIELLGCEVKSIRAASINLKESYIKFTSRQCFLVDCHISPYRFARIDKYDPVRERRLLLHRREIERLGSQVQRKGLTVVPLKVYFNKRGRCKLELGLGQGKKLYDKRDDVKAREAQREMERAMKR